MHHMARIILDQEAKKVAAVGASSDSFLVKAAAALASESMEKQARFFPMASRRPPGQDDNLTIAENPVLDAVRDYMQEHPPQNMDTLRDTLAQILEQDLQGAIAKGGSGPLEMEAGRLRAMADVMRSRLDLMRYARELKQFQTEMAKEMQLAQGSPAAEGAMQLPAKVSPLAQQGQQGQQAQQAQQAQQPVPDSPMEAASSPSPQRAPKKSSSSSQPKKRR